VKRTMAYVGAALLCGLSLSGCGSERKWSTNSEEAVRWMETGVKYWQQFNYTDALASLEKSIAADSQFAIAYGRMALVHLWGSNMPDARIQIARAMRLSGAATAREQQIIRLWSYRINEKHDEEAALADSLITLYPDETELYWFRGQCYENEGNFEAAVRLYNESAERDTSFALSIMSLGYAHSVLGDQGKAVKYMQQYIRMAPMEPDPLASYADILMRAGRYDEALDNYRKALTVKPDYWYAVREIGTVYMVKGRLREAEKQFEDAFRLLPANPTMEAGMLKYRGIVDIQRGRYDDAIALFRASLAIDSTYLGVAGGLVTAMARAKRFAEGWEVVDSVRAELGRRDLTDSPMMLMYHLMRSRLYTAEGKLDSAEEECRVAVEFSTPLSRGAIYAQWARIARAKRDSEGAIGAVENALSVNPNAPDALMTLALVYREKGDNQMAAEIGKRLLEMWREADPDFQPLAELREGLGKIVR
jgi:tetratricopeptide (TPR) repeat protein